MKSVFTLIKSVFFIFLSLAVLNGYSQKNKPNIVIIYVDDLGFGDIGGYGGERHGGPTQIAVAEKVLLGGDIRSRPPAERCQEDKGEVGKDD